MLSFYACQKNGNDLGCYAYSCRKSAIKWMMLFLAIKVGSKNSYFCTKRNVSQNSNFVLSEAMFHSKISTKLYACLKI